MAQGRKHFLINRHTPNQTGFPSDLKLGEIAVRHNEEAPELIINLFEGGDDSDFRTFIDKVAIINMLSATTLDLQGKIDGVSENLETNYATSADTHAAIGAVDAKFANYATSASTHAAIGAVDAKFANYATSADTHAAIAKVQGEVDAVEKSLDEAISALTETINTKVSSAYIYQGSKATFEELPNDDSVKVGHVWNVEAAHENHPAGTNYAWTGTEWDALAGIVDLTIYATSASTHAAIGAVDTKVDTLSNNLESNYATSASTHAAIGAVDAKFADYAKSADTHAAIVAVDVKFADYATSADTHAAIAAVQGEVDAVELRVESLESLSAATQSAIQTIEVSGVDGVKVTKSGTTRTIDFSQMIIDCGEF